MSGSSTKRRRRHRQSAHRAAVDLGKGDRPGLDHHVEPPAQQILHDLGIAAIRNAAQRDAGFDVDQLAGQVMHAAGHVHPVGDAERGGLGADYEIGKRRDGRIGGGRDHHGIG
jgi:hypothetical protein